MKIQIDTDNKTICLEEKVNLGEFFSKLEELFPDLKWREYTLETGIINYWTNPIIINPHIPYPPDSYPWTVYSTGTYNIDVT
ncbi:MAG: hypothetical protein H5T96_09345 [Tissierellales bacterium]|nr:hypothetical protein [Tissierellales bacterium]